MVAIFSGELYVDAAEPISLCVLLLWMSMISALCACADRVQAAEILIKEGLADVEAEDESGRTAMSHAAKHGSVDCLNLLGKEHADVFHKDKEGKTPLQIAELSSRTEVVTALKKLQQVSAACLHYILCIPVPVSQYFSSLVMTLSLAAH